MFKTIGQRQAMEQFINQEVPRASQYLSRELMVDSQSVATMLCEKWVERDIMSPPSSWAMEKITDSIVDQVFESISLARAQINHNNHMLIAKDDENAEAMQVLVGRAPLRAPIQAPPVALIARAGDRDRTTIIGRQ